MNIKERKGPYQGLMKEEKMMGKKGAWMLGRGFVSVERGITNMASLRLADCDDDSVNTNLWYTGTVESGSPDKT